MTVEEQLKAEIQSRYKSLHAFSVQSGIPNTTLDSIFRRGIWKSSFHTVLKIFDILDLDIESVKDGQIKGPRISDANIKNAPSLKDKTLLNSFHQLNDEGQEKVTEYVDDLVQSGKYIKMGTLGLGDQAKGA